jgi:hypothetical protein
MLKTTILYSTSAAISVITAVLLIYGLVTNAEKVYLYPLALGPAVAGILWGSANDK